MSGQLARAALVLLLASVFGSCEANDSVRARDLAGRGPKQPTRERLLGEHEVRAPVARAGLELALRRGFEVRLGKLAAPGAALLRIADQRVRSDEVASGFVPVGPSVELLGVRGSVDVSFVADKFRVRARHRLVLAVEQAQPCAGEACWRLVAARYEQGHCVARGVQGSGRRLQFGSLPEP